MTFQEVMDDIHQQIQLLQIDGEMMSSGTKWMQKLSGLEVDDFNFAEWEMVSQLSSHIFVQVRNIKHKYEFRTALIMVSVCRRKKNFGMESINRTEGFHQNSVSLRNIWRDHTHIMLVVS